MPPRKKSAQAAAPEQIDLEDAIAATHEVDYSKVKPAELIAEFHLLKAHQEEQSRKFQEWIKPTAERMEAIRQTLHGLALHDGVNAFSTDNGTAYLSTITNHSVDPESEYTSLDGRTSKGRDALLDWLLDNWDDFGSEGILLNVTKDAVGKWMDTHNSLPPGLKIDVLKRLNIKK